MRRRVLVIGASGFIGRRLVAALAATPWAQPVAASRTVRRVDFGPGVERVALDATDRHSLQQAMDSSSAVVSCMAGSAADIVASGIALLDAALARGSAAPRLVYLSSMAAYGSVRGSVDESAPLLGDLGDYSAAKAAIEHRAAPLTNVVRLRPGIVYGPESAWWSDRLARLLVAQRLGDLGHYGAGVCNAIHVDDVVTAVLRAIESPTAGGEAFNLGSPEPPTWNEYLRLYAHCLGCASVRRISRARLLTELALYGPALRLAEKALGQSNPWAAHPAIRPWLIGLCRHRIRMRVAKAEEMLGMQWRPLDVGLRETATWFMAGGRSI